LRQFIQTGFPQESADPGNPRVIFDLEDRAVHLIQICQCVAQFLGIDHHGPELIEHEFSSVESGPLLPVDNRPRRGQFYQQGHCEKDWCKQNNQGKGAHTIDKALHQQLQIVLRGRGERQGRDADKILKGDGGGLRTEHDLLQLPVRHDPDLDPQFFGKGDLIVDLLDLFQRDREDYLVDHVVEQERLELAHIAYHSDIADHGLPGVALIDLQAADDGEQAVFRIENGPNGLPGPITAADNQDTDLVLTPVLAEPEKTDDQSAPEKQKTEQNSAIQRYQQAADANLVHEIEGQNEQTVTRDDNRTHLDQLTESGPDMVRFAELEIGEQKIAIE